MRDWHELPISGQAETHDIAVTASIDDIHEVIVLCHGNWFAATTRHYIGKLKRRALHTKRRYLSTARVHCQQKRVVGCKHQRALGAQRISRPTTAPASGCKAMLVGQRTVVCSFVRNDFVLVSSISHHENGSPGLTVQSVTKDRRYSANCQNSD